ncbi:MAG TPA: hypothetical protein V6D03_10225 [Candidatus Caenarcaniphilales bacterium]
MIIPDLNYFEVINEEAGVISGGKTEVVRRSTTKKGPNGGTRTSKTTVLTSDDPKVSKKITEDLSELLDTLSF